MKSLRIALLLAVLAGVVVYAVHDILARRERNAWTRRLDVALVIVTEPGVDLSATAELRSRTSELSRRLAEELHRYRPDAPAPFAFVSYGPVPFGRALPSPASDSLLDAARYAWDLHRFTSDIDERASVPSRGFDSRLYLVVRATHGQGARRGHE